MTIESEQKIINEQLAIFNAELADFAAGKKVAAKRARAALNEIKKAAATSRKLIQEKVNAAAAAAAGGKF